MNSLILLLGLVAFVKCIPLQDELAQSELRSQKVSLTIVEKPGGLGVSEVGKSNKDKQPLQRAISYDQVMTVPLEFHDHVKKKPRKKNLKESR